MKTQMECGRVLIEVGEPTVSKAAVVSAEGCPGPLYPETQPFLESHVFTTCVSRT